ncbi:MAG: hypothetical protein AAF497_11790 [Planctomycetota bacterium]
MTGSNCCANDRMHWYELNSNLQITSRKDIQINIDRQRFALIPKAETRPFVMDWNRDGIQDLVVALRVFDRQKSATPMNQFQPKLFVKLGSKGKNLAAPIAAGPQQAAGTLHAAGTTIQLEPFEFNNGSEERWRKLLGQGWQVFVEFAFGDVDADGNVDLIFSEMLRRLALDQNTNRWFVADIKSGVYWMKNEAASAMPEFAEIRSLYQAEPKQAIIAIAAADVDQDGKLDVAIQSAGKLQLLSQSK